MGILERLRDQHLEAYNNPSFEPWVREANRISAIYCQRAIYREQEEIQALLDAVNAENEDA
jgi:hypothetical protein